MFISVARCPTLEIRNAFPSTGSHVYGDVIHVTCVGGHVFPGGVRTHSVECQHDGTWSSELPACASVTSCEFEGGHYDVGDVIGTSGCDGRELTSYRAQCLRSGEWSVPPVRRLCEIGESK